MELHEFSADDFSAKQWINKVLKQSPTCDNTLLHSLVDILQEHLQKVNYKIEGNCYKIVNNVPKSMCGARILNEKMSLFSEKIKIVKEDLENIDKNADDSVLKLEKIDKLKSTLENIRRALHEADNWSVLTANIEECFDRNNIEKVPPLLGSLQQSLCVLSNVNDYEDKKMQLEGLKNRLEATVSPNIVRAFTTYNKEDARKYVEMFQLIERLPQLLEYYNKCQKCSMCQYWKSLIHSDHDLNLLEQFRSMYDMFLLNWQKQIRWCSDVFDTVNLPNMVMNIYAETLMDLEPSVTWCIDSSLKQHIHPLTLLLEYYQCSKQFQKNLESISTFNNDSSPVFDWKSIRKSIYHPYEPFISKYGTLEKQLLDQCLMNCFSSLDNETDVMDYIRNLGLTISTVMNAAREAEIRCVEFTGGCALDGLIFALKGFFLEYLDKYKHISEKMSQQVISRENWSLLTCCLSLQQFMGEFLSEIRNLDSHLRRLVHDYKNDMNLAKRTSMIVSDALMNEFTNWLNNVPNSSNEGILADVVVALEKLICDVHNTSYNVSFQPISNHLEKIKEIRDVLNVDDRNMPDYSYSPLEYITQIGENLITLPQHLEPFLSKDNFALDSVLDTISKHCEKISPTQGAYANVLLTIVAHGICKAYSEQILNTRELNPAAVQQFAADINYLGNVLEELSIGLTQDLHDILQLLRLSESDYQTKSIGFPPKLVAAIRQIRKLQST